MTLPRLMELFSPGWLETRRNRVAARLELETQWRSLPDAQLSRCAELVLDATSLEDVITPRR